MSLLEEDNDLPLGTTMMAIQAVISSLLGLALFLVMVRFLNPSEFGVYSGILFVSVLVNTVGTLGLGIAASRYIPFYLSSDKPIEVRTFLRIAIGVAGVSAVFSSLLVIFLPRCLTVLGILNR